MTSGKEKSLISSDIASTFATTLAISSAVGVSLSSLFHIAFFFTIDPGLLQLFSFTDAIWTAVPIILPLMFGGLLGLALGVAASTYADRATRKLPKRRRSRYALITIYMTHAALFSLGVLFWLMDYLFISVAAFAFFLFEAVISNYIIRSTDDLDNSRFALVTGVVFWLASASLVFAFGAEFGNTSLERRKPNVRLYMMDGTRRTVIAIWAGSDYFLIKDDPRTVKVLSKDQVSEIEFFGVTDRIPRDLTGFRHLLGISE